MREHLNPRRWSFRSRLTATTTAVFVLAGAGLLLTVYLVLRQVVGSSIASVGAYWESPDGSQQIVPVPIEETDLLTPGAPETPVWPEPDESTMVAAADGEVYNVVRSSTQMLGAEVLSGVLAWSLALLVAFAVLTALLSSWLSRRALRRIVEVTSVAQAITDKDLSGRLDLPGPRDEIKELGDTIDRMLGRLEEAFAARERFIANASHELRTPLTTTRVALEIPLSQGQVGQGLRPSVERALAANLKSEELIASLLVLARGSAGVQESREPVVLSQLVARVVTDRLAEAAESGIELTVGPEAGRVVGDTPSEEISGKGTPDVVELHQSLVEQAVGNLVDNAVRHNAEGGQVWVGVAQRRTGEGDLECVVEVESTGHELSAEQVARFVEPFHRGAATRTAARRPSREPVGAQQGPTTTKTGLGLGLSVVLDVAAAHGGRLDLTPRDGGGLVARLTLRTGRPGGEPPG